MVDALFRAAAPAEEECVVCPPPAEEPAVRVALERLLRLSAAALGAPAALLVLDSGADCSRVSHHADPDIEVALLRDPALAAALCREVAAGGVWAVQSLPARIAALPAAAMACAAIAVRAPDSRPLGCLAVLRPAPHAWSAAELRLLPDLAATVENELALREQTRERRCLADTLRMLEHAVESMQLGFTVTGLDGRIVYTNPAEAAMHGYTVGELLGQPGSMLAPAEQRSAVPPAGLAQVSSWRREALNQRRDGSRFPVALWSDAVTDAAGRRLGMVTLSSDLSAQQRAEAHYRRLVATAPNGIFALDHEGCCVEANPAMERLLARPRAELLGCHFSRLLAEEGAPSPFRWPPPADGPLEAEFWVRRASGERRLVRVSAARIDEEGGLAGVHGVMRDITEERTRDEQLRRTERLAGLGTLVSGVAHELNNPLTSIRSYAQLLLLDARPADDEEALVVIAREAERAAKIVADLRLAVRPASSGGPRLEPVDLNDVVHHVLRLRDYALRTHNLCVEEVLAPSLPPLLGDRTQVEQVVLNLVINAEQAMTAQPAPKRLVLRTRTTAAGAVRLEVADSGPGVAPELRARIFDPFFTTKPPGEGTGLGLTLVHGIVGAHGGEIRLEATPGGGATFCVELPAAVPARAAPPPVLPAAPPALRVLVVDDEAPIRRSLARYLSRRGHQVEEAGDGAEAMARIEAEPGYDVILTDLRMPGLSGEQLLDWLRERGDGLERRLVFVTGDAASDDAARILAEAQLPVVLKPFDLGEVERVIERAALQAA